MIVREEETLRKTAVLQIVFEELFIRSIGSVFNALLLCFGQRKGENLNLDVSSGKIGCQFAGKQLGIGAGQVNITIEIEAAPFRSYSLSYWLRSTDKTGTSFFAIDVSGFGRSRCITAK